jgi:hypothetical protein
MPNLGDVFRNRGMDKGSPIEGEDAALDILEKAVEDAGYEMTMAPENEQRPGDQIDERIAEMLESLAAEVNEAKGST